VFISDEMIREISGKTFLRRGHPGGAGIYAVGMLSEILPCAAGPRAAQRSALLFAVFEKILRDT
jgi:hypothetical protein